MSLVGEAGVVLCNDKHSAHTVVLVASDVNHSSLIDWQDLQKLRVIPASFPAVAAVAQCFRDFKKNIVGFSGCFSDTLDNKPMYAQNIPQRQLCALSCVSSMPHSPPFPGTG